MERDDDLEQPEILDLEAMRTLRRDSPERLFAYLREVEREFLFGVEDRREHAGEWGGECRITINRNLVLHLVPGFNAEMTEKGELPQFCVFPDERRADQVEETRLVLDDGDEVLGAIFYVDPNDYDQLVADAARVAERYEDFEFVPDTYFLDTELLAYLNRVVLEHPHVRAQREYDWRLGLTGGSAPPPLAEEDTRLPEPPLSDEEYEELDELGEPEPTDAEVARFLAEAEARHRRRQARGQG